MGPSSPSRDEHYWTKIERAARIVLAAGIYQENTVKAALQEVFGQIPESARSDLFKRVKIIMAQQKDRRRRRC